MNYYNEFDPYAAQWLRSLIAAGHIPAGDVDERSIVDVRADDLRGYTQCHFFAGIAGWSLALALAGWPADRPVWTGSPPCQDNSVAASIHGRRDGLRGARSGLAHTWLDLVAGCHPGRVFFENVPGIEPWLAEIERGLAEAGYRVSKSKRSTADIAGYHLRRRVWVAAYRDSAGLEEPWQARPQSPFSDPRRAVAGNFWTAAPDRPGGFADGFPARVAAVRAFGNAIDPWVAAEFIRASAPDLHPERFAQ
mgnify:CR=1 FL=1